MGSMSLSQLFYDFDIDIDPIRSGCFESRQMNLDWIGQNDLSKLLQKRQK